MRKLLLILCLLLITVTVQAQTVIFLPVILKGDYMAVNPRLVITDGTTEVDLLGPDSGWKLANPYWNPRIAQYKGGGSFVNAQLAEGRRLVHKEYDNVVETIPLSLTSIDQDKAMQTAHELLELLRQAGDYWTEPYEYDDVWIEVKLACNDCFTGYARVIAGNIPEITNPFGQPFFSANNQAVMEGITVIIEREPFWRAVKPGERIGPLFNLLRNPDFEFWNFGETDGQPDNWTDIETLWITGTNNRQTTSVFSGQSALRIRVSGSTLTGASKGVTQNIDNIKDNTTYTIVARVRSEGVSNGVGRILVNYSSQLELYRESDNHGWNLYVDTITTGDNEGTVSIDCEILTTAANTDGTVYFDALMFLEGDFEQYALDGVLPYITSSQLVNHWDQPTGKIEAGDINFIDVHSIPGNVEALVRLEIYNNTEPSDFSNIVEVIKTLRIGQRRLKNVFNFTNYFDPAGVIDTTASSDDRIPTPALNNNWQTITGNIITENTLDNAGRFRALLRVWDEKASDSNLEARLNYYIGTGGVSDKTIPGATSQIVGNWTILNLTPTKSIIYDFKFSSDTPAQMGYNVQMKRDSGADLGRIDYLMLMPTDGGYMEATINPPMGQNIGLIIDADSGVLSAASATLSSEWTQIYLSTSERLLRGFIQFQGRLFMGMYPTGGIDAIIKRQNDSGNWDTVYQNAGNNLPPNNTFAIYNGQLFSAVDTGATQQLISTNNGLDWTIKATTADISAVYSLGVFNGYLWASGLSTVGADTAISRFDGTSWDLVYTNPADNDDVHEFQIYKGKLYTCSDGGYIYTYDPVANSWSAEQIAVNRVSSLGIFTDPNGKEWLYAGNGLGGTTRIYRTDGTGWNAVQTFTDLDTIESILEFEGKLYILGQATGVGNTVKGLFVSSNGTTFTEVPGAPDNSNATGFDAFYGTNLYLANGVMYATYDGNGSNDEVRVWANSQPIVQYEVSTYKSSNRIFTSPPHKRHRWFFNYDRDNFVNNADDKILVGVGFVPRYLTLRGKN